MSPLNVPKPVQRPISPMLGAMDDDFEGLDSDEPMEKDETEIELEKLVFGDDSGFHEGLKSYKDASNHLRDLVDGDKQQVQDGLEEGILEGLDDSDVCKVDSSSEFAFAQHTSSYSSSTLIRPVRMSQTFCPTQNQGKARRCHPTATPRHGLIATTNVSSSPWPPILDCGNSGLLNLKTWSTGRSTVNGYDASSSDYTQYRTGRSPTLQKK